METIAKFIRALFFDGEEVNKSVVTRVKDVILMLLMGGAICLAVLYCLGDSDSDDEESDSGYVEYNMDDNEA